MMIEVTIVDDWDRASVRHCLTCEAHRQELIDHLAELIARAVKLVPPVSVMMRVRPEGTRVAVEEEDV